VNDSTSVLVAPRGRVGERPPHSISASGFRGSASGCWRLFGLRFLAPGLRIWKPGRLSLCCRRRAPSHLWLGAGPRFAALRLTAFKIPPHSREAEFGAWDCKVTPADCTCQEGNTTGCIPSNDGLDAGLGLGFPHCGKPRAVAIGWAMGKNSPSGTYLTAGAGVAVVSLRTKLQPSLGDEFPVSAANPALEARWAIFIGPSGT
jgi:hypothetical protein